MFQGVEVIREKSSTAPESVVGTLLCIRPFRAMTGAGMVVFAGVAKEAVLVDSGQNLLESALKSRKQGLFHQEITSFRTVFLAYLNKNVPLLVSICIQSRHDAL